MSKSRQSPTLTLDQATIAEARAEGLEDWFALHWEEVENDQAVNPLSINWSAYRDLERTEVLRVYLLRRGKRLIGYSCWFLQPLLHHATTRWAVCDLLYVIPEERKGWAGVFLIRESVRRLKADGARIINVSVKPRSNLDSQRGRGTVGTLLEKLGFSLAEETWVKYL